MPRHLNKLLTLLVYALLLLAAQSVCSAKDNPLNDKELKKAEKILVKLTVLQTASTDLNAYKIAVRKFYPELFVNVASLRDGDLKTDLTTAAFLYEQAADLQSINSAANCHDEVRDLYRNLCLTHTNNPTRSQLLLSKAQLHTSWAASLIRFYRGDMSATTLATLSEIKKEREIDLTIAARVVSILKTLDEEVNPYSSLGKFEEHNRVAKVSFAKLSKDFDEAATTAQQLLSSLPRNLIYYHLKNALNSYSDGLFWWQKTYRRKEAVVSVNNWTEPAAPKPLGFDADALNYTVICNWRKASKHITTAAAEIEKARNSPLISNSSPSACLR